MSSPKSEKASRKKSGDVRAEEQSCASPGAQCEKIRELAHSKWEAAGCPCGDGVEFWLQAEAELVAEA
jgi:hypothetical protein